MNHPLIIGLTGQTGAGKSAASAMLSKDGFFVIDCDHVAREVVEPGSDGLHALTEVFSREILCADGSLDRKALGKRVFTDSTARALLNDTIFPFITRRVEALIQTAAAQGKEAVILDAPTLFESGMDKICALIVAVCADADRRKARIMARDCIDEQMAQARMNSQYPESFFKEHCAILIENNGTEAQFAAQVHDAAMKIKERIHGCSHS